MLLTLVRKRMNFITHLQFRKRSKFFKSMNHLFLMLQSVIDHLAKEEENKSLNEITVSESLKEVGIIKFYDVDGSNTDQTSRTLQKRRIS